MKRPEHVVCVKRDRVDMPNQTWCGKTIFGFHFVNSEHSANNGAQNGRLVACFDCTQEIIKGLINGQDE